MAAVIIALLSEIPVQPFQSNTLHGSSSLCISSAFLFYPSVIQRKLDEDFNELSLVWSKMKNVFRIGMCSEIITFACQ